MTSNVFLAAVTQPDFEETVLSPAPIGEESGHPTLLENVTDVRIWGAPPSAETHFEKLEAGDLVLFVDGETYVGVGTIGQTLIDEEGWAQSTLWGETAYTHLYTLADFSPVTVPKSAVNRIFEYGATYTPGALMRIADNRINRPLAVIRRALVQYSDKHQQ